MPQSSAALTRVVMTRCRGWLTISQAHSHLVRVMWPSLLTPSSSGNVSGHSRGYLVGKIKNDKFFLELVNNSRSFFITRSTLRPPWTWGMSLGQTIRRSSSNGVLYCQFSTLMPFYQTSLRTGNLLPAGVHVLESHPRVCSVQTSDKHLGLGEESDLPGVSTTQAWNKIQRSLDALAKMQ